MNPKLPFVASCAAALWFAGTAPARQTDAPPNGVDVLTRGPVHEAYAEPTDPRPQATPIVPQQPPAPVVELPPDVRPEGANVVWIPGYWSWDDESRGFLWVSGLWRESPPDRMWVSGYWQQAEGGRWQWVPGYWAADSVNQVEYLPQPPDPVPEAQPPAPNANSVYVPGIWMWRSNNYFWRPGFYAPYQADWNYTPAHYTYSPNGYVFVEGYWDHPLHRRGVLFSPVRFDAAVLANPNWTYLPQYVVSPDALLTAMFVRPATYSYYFGDYFDPRYARNYVPWVDYRVSRSAYDPSFAYYAATYQRSDPNWIRGMRDLYTARREGTFPRPPSTWADQSRFASNFNEQNAAVLRSLGISNPRSLGQVATPLTQVRELRSDLFRGRTTAGGNGLRMQPLSQDQRTQAREGVRQAQDVQQRRQEAEARLGPPTRPGEAPQQPRTVRLDLPRTTTSARATAPGTVAQPGRQPPPLPQRPTVHERPGVPERGSTLGRPETARPGTPEQPGVPGRPAAPERPAAPQRPGAPERPAIPGRPGIPETPGIAPPSRPTTPGRPMPPERPEAPRPDPRPAAPERPAAPATPPQRPEPPRPVAPERPAAPAAPRPEPRPPAPPHRAEPPRPVAPERPAGPPAPPQRAEPPRPAAPPPHPEPPRPPAPPQRPEPPRGERPDREKPPA